MLEEQRVASRRDHSFEFVKKPTFGIDLKEGGILAGKEAG